MSELQQYYSQQLVILGSFKDLLSHTENQLGLYMPPDTWKGHQGIKFLVNLATDEGTHVRLRKNVIEDLGLSYQTQLSYKPELFLALLIQLCREEMLDIDTLLGCSWTEAPTESNYVLFVLLMTLLGLEKKSFLLEATLECMKSVKSKEYIEKTSTTVVEVKTPLSTHFSKYQKPSNKTLKPGTTVAETFSTRYKKYMDALKGMAQVLTATKTDIKSTDRLANAVRARIGNKGAQKFAKSVGIDEKLDEKFKDMEADSEVEFYFDPADPEELGAPEIGVSVTFAVDINKTRDFVSSLNTASRVTMLEKAIKLIGLNDIKLLYRQRIVDIRTEELMALQEEQRKTRQRAQELDQAERRYRRDDDDNGGNMGNQGQGQGHGQNPDNRGDGNRTGHRDNNTNAGGFDNRRSFHTDDLVDAVVREVVAEEREMPKNEGNKSTGKVELGTRHINENVNKTAQDNKEMETGIKNQQDNDQHVVNANNATNPPQQTPEQVQKSRGDFSKVDLGTNEDFKINQTEVKEKVPVQVSISTLFKSQPNAPKEPKVLFPNDKYSGLFGVDTGISMKK